MAAATTSPAPAVGRGVVSAAYGGQPVTLSFALNTLLAYTTANGITPSAAVELLGTNALGLIRGLTFHALRRAGAAIENEEAAGDWLETVDEATGDAIGKAIGAALTVPNPTLAGLQGVMQTRFAEIAAASGTN